jgi:hypothetical protein
LIPAKRNKNDIVKISVEMPINSLYAAPENSSK